MPKIQKRRGIFKSFPKFATSSFHHIKNTDNNNINNKLFAKRKDQISIWPNSLNRSALLAVHFRKCLRSTPLLSEKNVIFVSGTFMLILLFFRTVINSLRFKVFKPSVLFWPSGFCHLHPSSLARMEGPYAFVRWRHCVMAPVFLSKIFVQVYLSLQRTVSMFRTAENEQQRMYEQCEI